ncbi:hypothetical protein D9611_003954 [Ephemerocybe angulata]|uniref:Uncharacterized protein n=1 Tax=Ephemerocybe angulata TaxID=980116 RepID=A0A8H5B5G2_9AGAR|nr:hypothetical protein D9611_003954 [Tulosesus angulatus]
MHSILLAFLHSPPLLIPSSTPAMCRIHSEGTQHGCGHYIITREVSKRDCNSKGCIKSAMHPPSCPNCACKRFLEPDFQETVTAKTKDFCAHCQYWFKKNGTAPPPQR